MKVCSKCKEYKELSFFNEYKTGRRAGRYWAECKEYRKTRLYRWRKENPERYKEHFSKARFKYRYNVDKSLRDLYIDKPCMICGKLAKRYAVDHCHDTYQIRGVICLNCNTLLGHLENKDKMSRIDDYLNLRLTEQKPFLTLRANTKPR